MLSICLCSWNDLPFLKILYAGVKRNTRLSYEFIVHDNGSTDGTEEWLKENNIKYTRSETNEGVAAVNYAVEQATGDYIVDINADMYPLPGWDTEIWKQVTKFRQEGVEKFTISSCLVEPRGANPEYTIKNHGTNPESFNEEGLMQDFLNNAAFWKKVDTTQYSHPISMPKKLWDEMGGVDFDYPYGLATDHDIAARAYNAGCRNFKMLGRSRVYHFVGQTIRKLPADRPNAEPLFFDKWGVTVQEFRNRLGVAKPFKEVDPDVLP